MAVETTRLPLPREQLVQMYRQMWAIRHFDSQVIKLFMEGLIRGSTHAYIGMEAVAVGTCITMAPRRSRDLFSRIGPCATSPR